VATSVVVKQHHSGQKPPRDFTRWSKSHTAIVQQYFTDYRLQTNPEFIEFKKSWFRKLTSTVLTLFI